MGARWIAAGFCLLAGLGLLAAPARADGATGTTPGVEFANPTWFEDEDGARYSVEAGRLTDGSLRFIRIQLPDGILLTLPGLISASGARYGDDGRFQWWEHQGEVLFESLDPVTGEWHRCRLQRLEK